MITVGFASYLKIVCTSTEMVEHLWMSHVSRLGKGGGKVWCTLKALNVN